jgi:hypothetical protein
LNAAKLQPIDVVAFFGAVAVAIGAAVIAYDRATVASTKHR